MSEQDKVEEVIQKVKGQLYELLFNTMAQKQKGRL